MRFYDPISKYLNTTEGIHYINGMEWNYSQLTVGAAEGRSTGTNYDKHSYTDAWRTVVLSDQQNIIPLLPISFCTEGETEPIYPWQYISNWASLN